MRFAYLLLYVAVIATCLTQAGCSHTPLRYQHLQMPMKSYEVSTSPKIVLVLGGGGSKGLAHLGVLSVLEAQGIRPDLIIGTSAGSLIGALYADNPHARDLMEDLIQTKQHDIIKLDYFSFFRMLWRLDGLNNGQDLIDFMETRLKTKHFEDLKIPLVVVTTDLIHNEVFLIGSGEIIPALHASSAVPFVFTPVHLYDRVLIDGGVISPVPVEIAKSLHPKMIIAVDVGAPPPPDMPPGNLSLLYHSAWITYDALAKHQRVLADVVIRPKTDNIGMFDDNQNQHLIAMGSRAAYDALPAIRKHLKAKKLS